MGNSGNSRLRTNLGGSPIDSPALYNTLAWIEGHAWPGGSAVVRCPKCAVEIDVDEDEVEEGEILNCPECESELEVVQIHPVNVNIISDDEDDDDEDEEEDDDEEDDDDDEDDKVEDPV